MRKGTNSQKDDFKEVISWRAVCAFRKSILLKPNWWQSLKNCDNCEVEYRAVLTAGVICKVSSVVHRIAV